MAKPKRDPKTGQFLAKKHVPARRKRVPSDFISTDSPPRMARSQEFGTAGPFPDTIVYRGGSREAERGLSMQGALRLYGYGRALGLGNLMTLAP